MKRAMAQLIEALERFWTYIVVAALLFALASSFLFDQEVVPARLTKENVQQALVRRPGHIVPHKALRYKGEDGWTWVCKKVLLLSQESDTYAVVKVEEGGVKAKPFFHGLFDHSRSDYVMDTRFVNYELTRESDGDNWLIDTIDGKRFRRYRFLKCYLKFEDNEKK
jgi:hypothetical protein